MRGCMRVYACTSVTVSVSKSYHLEKFNVRKYSADRAAPKADAALSFVLFSLKLIHSFESYDDFNFLKNICNRPSCDKFQVIELNNSE